MDELLSAVAMRSMRAKVLYKSSKRGMRELDIIFDQFNKKFLNDFTYQELCVYEEVLNMQDQDVLSILSSNIVEQEVKNGILAKLTDFIRTLHKN